MGQDAAGTCTVGEKLAAVLFGGEAQTDGILFEGDGAVSHDSVKAQPRNVQHVFGTQLYRLSAVCRIGICQRACAVTVYFHTIRQQRIQSENLAPAAANDLTIGVRVLQAFNKTDDAPRFLLIKHRPATRPYIIAPPRMRLYEEYSSRIYATYLKYVSSEDIIVYSIDEVFIDVTNYLRTYGMTAHELTMTMVRDVLYNTGITATAGIGTNLFLAKIAMDIEAN